MCVFIFVVEAIVLPFLFVCAFAGYGQNFDGLIPTTDFGAPTAVPKFISRGHLYKAVVGDTIELPCRVSNLGKYINEN